MKKFLSNIFLSPNERRLRAGWRLLLFFALYILISIPFSFLFNRLSYFIPIREDLLYNELPQFFAFTAAIWIARRVLDKRRFAALGLRLDSYTLRDIFAGIAIPFVLMGLIFLAEWAAGWLRVESFAWQTQSIGTILPYIGEIFLALILVAWNEELMTRGYLLQTFASGINLFWGVFLSSAIFGLLHIFNPHATLVSAAGIFFAGLFLAYGYLRTGNLWLSIGLHLGWNFFEGPVFGFPVSGLRLYALPNLRVSGPELWTGGAFGPEAGLIVLPALALGAGLIHLYTRNRARPDFQDF